MVIVSGCAREIFELLQPDIACGPVYGQRALYDDVQIAHRGYFEWLDHPEIGRAPYNGLQATLSLTPRSE